MSLYNILATFESVGVFDIALPFLLIFTISFAIFQKIELFGKDKKNIDLIVSLVLAFLAIRNIFLISLLNRFLPNTAMFLIIILMFLLLLGTFIGPLQGFKGYMVTVAAIISFIFVIMALGIDLSLGYLSFYNLFPQFIADFFYDYQTRATILFIAGIIIVIALVTGGSSNKGFNKGFWGIVDELGEKLGGKK